MLGQFATTAFAGFFLAQHLASMWLLSNGHDFSPEELLLAYASVPLSDGINPTPFLTVATLCWTPTLGLTFQHHAFLSSSNFPEAASASRMYCLFDMEACQTLQLEASQQ